ncbi:MAG: CNP1-like family protein [Azoarcus sp.]|jgi:hypothetical protein|nr:CNP1-like family protein [Azoarcus sp.]
MRIVLACLVFVLAPFAGWAQGSGEDGALASPAWREAEYVLPARPDERNLLAFRVGSRSDVRFLLDRASLSIGEDGVIRYVLVMRGSGGASTATFEGIRCGARESKLYASLERNGDWRTFRNSVWRTLAGADSRVIFGYSGNDPRATLAHDYLCDGPAPARTPEEIINRLRGQRIDYLDPAHGAGS